MFNSVKLFSLKPAFCLMIGACVVAVSGAVQAQVTEFRTAAQDSFPKYYREAKGPFQGLCADILRAFSEIDPGLKPMLEPGFVPMARIQRQMESGNLDAFFCMARNEARMTYAHFLEPPLYRVSHVIAVRADDDLAIRDFDDIRALGRKGVVLTMHRTAADRFLNAQGGLILETGNSVTNLLKRLMIGRVRMVYYHDLGLSATIRKEKLERQVRLLPTSFRQYHRYLAVSHSADASIRERLGAALQKLHKSGDLLRIADHYFIR